MYVTNLKTEFYEFLPGKRIFLMVHYDIDSICACKILQRLLQFKHILYTLCVIEGVDDLKRAFAENSAGAHLAVLINCGGTVDLVDVLEPAPEAVLFVLDAHRPTDLANVYSPGQVRLLAGAEAEVPPVDEIYSEEEEEEEGEGGSEEEGENPAKRRRLAEGEIDKRREKRLWQDKRDKVLFDYYQFTYYAKASAITMYNLAWQIAQDNTDLLWYAIIGLTSQYLFGQIDDALYVLEAGALMTHANRLKNRSNSHAELATLKITYEEDLKLVLYRHWTLIDSLKYSMLPACTLKLWSHRGARRLHELLAEMGFPLAQAHQTFNSMDMQLRNEFFQTIKAAAGKYDMDDLVFTSFLLRYGYRNRFSASDVVYGMLAMLEYSPKVKSNAERFSAALDCLNRGGGGGGGEKGAIFGGIEGAKIIAQALYRTVQKAVDLKQIVNVGPFLQFNINEGSLDCHLFSNQHILFLLANFILRAFVAMSRSKRAANLPLVVSSPRNAEAGTCLLLGIPPLAENSPKSFFGKAFERTAEQIKCDSSYDFFDTSYFEIYTRDRVRFFDALTALLT